LETSRWVYWLTANGATSGTIQFARVPVCGLIAQYNATGPAPEPNLLLATMHEVLIKSHTLRGFINYEFAAEHYPVFLRTVTAAVADGRIRYHRRP
jgi:NADPH-dependent curcumin reductase